MKRQGPARIPDRPNGAGGYAEQALDASRTQTISHGGAVFQTAPPGSRRGRGFGGSAPVTRGAGGEAPCWGMP